MRTAFVKGQRWINESEPELGVGVIVDVAPGRVFLLFRTSNTLRQYATDSAPIKRVEFRPGDTIKTHDGASVLVETVETRDGMLLYHGAGREVPETDLSDTLSFSKPEDRLFAGQVDDNATFDLRHEAQRRRHQIRRSPVRGFVGARIDLIPHQLSIAQEVAARALPRVLLADEVGLGKTIEAGLILHRLHRSGRAARILILVPEPLVHQWFVELLRRFNLLVRIFDEARCLAIESGEPGANPFLDDQVILCPIPLVALDPHRAAQAVAADWDLVVVDEAHHLAWSPAGPSPEYRVVEALAAKSPGVILLTATPEQLGAEGHFARLRLLDPHRYADFARFQAGQAAYQGTARIAASLLDGKTLAAPEAKTLRQLHPSARLEENLAGLRRGEAAARDALVRELLDQHGPGRVMFRNTRAAMKGFPKRRAFLQPLPGADLSAERLADAAAADRSYALGRDPRIGWLVAFLAKKRTAKVLLICRTREKALEIERALKSRVSLKLALFHEDLTLLQRDRHAAWFAEPDGARLLLCSEIGSEGRNFQFAHHLVLFDLPENPELLEQRIGRLDRIGQTETIAIHVPFPRGTHLETLARWYHDGLGAFEKSLEGSREILARFGERIFRLLAAPDEAALGKLIEETRAAHAGIARALARGQDRLLQMNSFRPDVAARVIAQISAADSDVALDAFLLRVFDHFGVQAEELSPRTYRAVPAQLTTDAFPELPAEGLTLTADRTRALQREEIGFLSWDHPIVTGSIDLLLGAEAGNSAFAVWPGDDAGILLETIHVLEPVAPAALHADRFLPPTPLRVVVNAEGENVSADVNPLPGELRAGAVFQLLDNRRIKQKLLPAMLEKTRELAAERALAIARSAIENMRGVLRHEAERLRDLQRSNDHIRDEEIALIETQMEELARHLEAAPVRLDAVRLILRTPDADPA